MSMPVGSVHVDVVPSTRDFVKDMRKQLLDEADNIGKEMGQRIGRDMVDQIAKPVSDGIEKGVDKADPKKGATKTGKQAGDAFSRAFEREVRGALSSLPNINLEVETDAARRSVGTLRAQLQELFNEDGSLKVDVANEQGLDRIREIRTELRRLRDENVNIEVDYDIDKAIEQLGKLEKESKDRGKRAGDAFGTALRSTLDSAMRALPDIDVGVNLDDAGAMAELQVLHRQLAGLQNLEIGVDIREDQAIAGLRAILAELDRLAQDVTVSVRVRDDASTSAIALRGFLDRLFPEQQKIDYFVEFETAPAEQKVGAFARQIQRDIGGAIEALPEIQLNMDSTDAEFRLDAIRRELRGLQSQRIGIDIDADTAFARLQEIRVRLEALRALTTDPSRLNFDTSQAIASLKSVADAMDQVVTKGEAGRRVLNRFQEIGLLITLAFTPAAAAILALAAAGLAVVAPIAAIAAGINGIKAAVGPLTDDLNKMRSAVSAAFVEGLVPAVGAAAMIMPVLTTGLSNVATGLSALVTDMLSAVTQGGNLSLLTTVFDQMSRALSGLGPSMGVLLSNILQLADIGSAALITFGPLLDEVGAAWTRVIESLRQTGAGEAAVVALLQALTALLTLIAPLVQLGSAMFAVIGTALAAAINATASAVQFLADAFDALPGSVQSVLAAVFLLRVALAFTDRSLGDIVRSVGQLGGRAGNSLVAPFQDGAAAVSLYRETLDSAGRSTAGWSQATQSAGARVTSSLDNVAARMRTSIPQAAEAAGKSLSEGLVRATDLAARAFDRLPDAAVTGAKGVVTALKLPIVAVQEMDKAFTKGVDNMLGALVRGEQRIVDAGKSIWKGWNSAVDAGGKAIDALGKSVDIAGNGISKLLGSVDAAGNAIFGTAEKVGLARQAFTGWSNALDATGNAIFGTGEKIGLAQRAWTGWGTAVDATGKAIIGSVKAIDSAVDATMMRTPQLLGQAARAASTAVANGFRGMEDTLRRVPDAFRDMGTSIGNGLSTIPTIVGRAGQAIETGLVRMGTVAEGAGRSMSAGFGKAIGGLMDALGGPWGLIISAAVAALSLFGAAQADAAAKSAEMKSAVQETAQAMREAGGAVTQNMRDAELLTLIQGGLADSARTVGESLKNLTNTAIDGGAAWDQMRQRLVDQVDAGNTARDTLNNLTAANIDQATATMLQGEAAQQLLPQLDKLSTEYRKAADENRIFEELIRQSGNSMVGGIGEASQLTSALNALSNEMSTTADRAKALYTAMLLLTGGTLPVELAVSNMRAAMADAAKAMEEAQAAAAKAGGSILNAAGQIDTTTAAGRALIDSFTAVGKSALDAATAAFQAAGGMQNVAAASAAARDVVAQQREAFLKAADGAGIGAAAANRYADQLGLIPDLVVTLLRAEGLPLAQQEILRLQGLLQSVPPNTLVHVQVLSEEAFGLLKGLGVEINRLPDGSVDILATDKTAVAVAGILAAIAAQEGKLPVTLNGAAVPPAADALRGDIAGGPPAKLPVDLNGAPIPPTAAQLRGEIAAGPAAQLPVEADGTPVPPAVGALRADVAGNPAEMPITAVDSGATGLFNALRANAGQVVNMPITATDVGAVGLINALRSNIGQPNNMPITARDAGATGMINALRGNIAQINTMPITASDSGATGLINALRGNIGQLNAMPITATDVGAVGLINSLRSNISQVNTMPVTASDSGASVMINALRQSAIAVAVMPIDANPALARDKLRVLVDDINRARGTVIVDANTKNAQDAIDRLKTPTRSTHTVTIVTVGQLPRAMGGIVPANFSLFENGGLHNGRLTPMRANYARVVQPNTYRVIGDRARDAEAYIPINQAPRSQAILKVTAAQMGWGLHPLAAMATGGMLATRRDTLATQSTGSFQANLAAPTGGAVNARGVEQRLDAIAGLLAATPRSPTSITVEDRSGDPVQTARATQLALRLARH